MEADAPFFWWWDAKRHAAKKWGWSGQRDASPEGAKRLAKKIYVVAAKYDGKNKKPPKPKKKLQAKEI